VPGFFLTAIAVNAALRRRSFARFALMLGSASLVSAVLAYHFADVGSAYLVAAWNGRSGAGLDVVTVGARAASPLVAGATLLAWVVLIAAGRKAAADRSWWPLLAPGAAYVGVAGLRNGGFAFGELSGAWFARLAQGDGTALVSSVLAVALAGAFIAQAWRDGSERRLRIEHAKASRTRRESRQPLA
jgi:hypothetical protein